MQRLFVWACLFSCLFASNAFAQEKLTFQLQDGSKRVYQTENKSEQTLTIAGMDLDTKATAFQTTTHTLGTRAADGTIRQTEKVDSLQVDMQLPGGLSFSFDSGNPNKAVENVALEPLANLLRTTSRMNSTLIFDRDNVLKDVEVPADVVSQIDPMFQGDFTPEKLKKRVQNQRNYLPSEPVKPGNKWEVNTDASIGGGQTFSFRTEYQYAGTVDQNGQKLHKILQKPLSVSYAQDPAAPTPLKVVSSELQIADASGEILFDNDRGITVSNRSKTHIMGPMKFSINGQELDGKVDLTITQNIQLQP